MSTLRTNEIKMLDDRGSNNFTFDSVADLQASTQLTVGQKVRTLGYYDPGDGGGNDYEIVADVTGVDDGGSFIDLDNGLQAKGMFPGHTTYPAQFGVIYFGSEIDQREPYQNFLISSVGKRNYTPDCHIYVGGTLEHPVGLYWELSPNAKIECLSSFSPLVQLGGDTPVDTERHHPINADIDQGQKTLNIPTGMSIEVGDHILIGSNFRYEANIPASGEVHQVIAVEDGLLTLDEFTYAEYKASDNPFIAPFRPPSGSSIEGGHFVGIPGSDQFHGYTVSGVTDFHATGLTVEGFDRRGIRLAYTLNSKIEKCRFININGSLGYSVLFDAGNQHCSVRECTSFGCGKLFDVSGTSSWYGFSRWIFCENNTAINSRRVPFGTHSSGEYIYIRYNTAISDNGDGRGAIHTRTSNTFIEGNFLQGAGSLGYGVQARSAGIPGGTISVIGNKISGCETPIKVDIGEGQVPGYRPLHAIDSLIIKDNHAACHLRSVRLRFRNHPSTVSGVSLKSFIFAGNIIEPTHEGLDVEGVVFEFAGGNGCDKCLVSGNIISVSDTNFISSSHVNSLLLSGRITRLSVVNNHIISKGATVRSWSRPSDGLFHWLSASNILEHGSPESTETFHDRNQTVVGTNLEIAV